MAEYGIQFTGTNVEGNSDVLKLTITTANTTSTVDGFTGYLITAITGTFDGQNVTLLKPGDYNNNDNLFSPTGQHFSGGNLGDGGLAFSANAFGHSDNILLYFDGSDYTLSDHLFQTYDTNTTLTVTVCFASGSRIKTTRGEIAVEDLAVGDKAVTASGEARAIAWIGHKRIGQPGPAQWPVRVMAGAFGDGLPERDLLLSPGHAICLDAVGEVFIPVDKLVNGATIAREAVSDVTYWHVELESHDVLLAEGLPCESYMDTGNRAFFGREYGRLVEIDAQRLADSLTRYARPFVDQGPIVEAIHQRLHARAEALGWTRTSDMDLHLDVDGRRIEPEIDGDLARFVFPAEAKSARLVSRTFIPGADGRALGICVTAVAVAGRKVRLDEIAGFHREEAESGSHWRWTDGDLALASELWAGLSGEIRLAIAFDPHASSAWIGPEFDALRAAA